MRTFAHGTYGTDTYGDPVTLSSDVLAFREQASIIGRERPSAMTDHQTRPTLTVREND